MAWCIIKLHSKEVKVCRLNEFATFNAFNHTSQCFDVSLGKFGEAVRAARICHFFPRCQNLLHLRLYLRHSQFSLPKSFCQITDQRSFDLFNICISWWTPDTIDPTLCKNHLHLLHVYTSRYLYHRKFVLWLRRVDNDSTIFWVDIELCISVFLRSSCPNYQQHVVLCDLNVVVVFEAPHVDLHVMASSVIDEWQLYPAFVAALIVCHANGISCETPINSAVDLNDKQLFLITR